MHFDEAEQIEMAMARRDRGIWKIDNISDLESMIQSRVVNRLMVTFDIPDPRVLSDIAPRVNSLDIFGPEVSNVDYLSLFCNIESLRIQETKVRKLKGC